MHRVFESMKQQKYGSDGSITIRGGIWQDWLRAIEHEIQPELDAAKHLAEQGFTVSPAAAEALGEARAKRRSA